MGLRNKDVSVFHLLFLFALSCENNSVLMNMVVFLFPLRV